MPDPIKFGALCWNQNTDWPSLLEAGIRAERVGFDTLWTWDKWLGSRIYEVPRGD